MHHLVDSKNMPSFKVFIYADNTERVLLFFPRFNIIDEPPYATGEPCSECPEQYHECEQHLCSKLINHSCPLKIQRRILIRTVQLNRKMLIRTKYMLAWERG